MPTPMCARCSAAVGVESLDDLFAAIPEEVRFAGRLDLPEPAAEADVLRELAALAARNRPATELVSFLGAGIYDTYVPAVVEAITSRSEFLTSYTPYQAERSQGLLQAIFEYQTAICELTGLDVSNASMYDGATALAEAVILATTHGHRGGKVVVSAGVHPEYRRVLATETRGLGPAPLVVPDDDGGLTDLAALRAAVDGDTAAVVIAQPSFFGGIEDVAEIVRIAHEAGALAIVVADPLALGVLASPGEQGADIAVGEGQSLGNYQNFGGPGFGFFAARKELTRRMPGRIVGETVDVHGKRGFVLTLQTREQHIRRERATSNICSNHALNALAGLVYLSWLGKEGLPALGLQLAARPPTCASACSRCRAWSRTRAARCFASSPSPCRWRPASLWPRSPSAATSPASTWGAFRARARPRAAAGRERAPDARRDRLVRRGGEQPSWLRRPPPRRRATRPRRALSPCAPSSRSRGPAAGPSACRPRACPRRRPTSCLSASRCANDRRACPRSPRSTCCVTSSSSRRATTASRRGRIRWAPAP